MPYLRLSPAALRDLDRLHGFLEERNPSAADAAIQAIRDAVPMLLKQPGIGQPIQGKATERQSRVRFGRAAYLIRYDEEPDGIVILEIRHSRERRI